MTAVYAIALLTGALLLLGWVVATATAGAVAGWEVVNPERRFGAKGRGVVAALLGFGLAGLSASFAGWSTLVALLAGLGGGAAVWAVSRVLGPQDRRS